jgi:hypothetical protein
MSPGTFPSVPSPCCENYEIWAGRLRLAHSQRLKLARRTNGSGGSAWPTAISQDAKQSGHAPSGLGQSEKLSFAVIQWPTPMAGTPAQNGNNAAGNSDFSRGVMELWKTPDVPNGGRSMPKGTTPTGMTPDGKKLTVGLENQSRLWGTPRATDGTHGGPNQTIGGKPALSSQAATWPTPAARDHKGSSEASVTRVNGKSRLDLLDHLAEQAFHRPDPETPRHGPPSSVTRPISRQLFRSAMSNVPATTLRRWLRKGNWRKARLNPAFVGWLMNSPSGHHALNCSVIQWRHWQRQSRGALCHLPITFGPWIWEPPTETQPQPEQIGFNL